MRHHRWRRRRMDILRYRISLNWQSGGENNMIFFMAHGVGMGAGAGGVGGKGSYIPTLRRRRR